MSEPTSSKVPPTKIREWTFMVYMAAGDSHKLDTVAVRDLEEMEIGTKGNENVGVVVQINRHWPKTAQRYAITKGKTLPAALPALTEETNMADEKTLSAFLKSVVSNDEYRATNYCLVLWGHAFGVGFGRDGEDALLLPELRRALEALQESRSGKPLEILGTNACSMSYLEAAFELKDVVSLMVASQITVPFAGWPYHVILNRIGPCTKKRALAEMIVNAYVTQFDDLPGGDRLAMTVLDLKQAKECGRRLESLATAIHNEINDGFNTDTMAELRDIFMGAAAGDVRPLVDLTTLCEILGGKGTIEMAIPIEQPRGICSPGWGRYRRRSPWRKTTSSHRPSPRSSLTSERIRNWSVSRASASTRPSSPIRASSTGSSSHNNRRAVRTRWTVGGITTWSLPSSADEASVNAAPGQRWCTTSSSARFQPN